MLAGDASQLPGSGSSYDDVHVHIYPADCDAASHGAWCRRRAPLTAALSATAVAVGVFCVAAVVWTGHTGRRTTPAATDLVNHFAVSDGRYF